MRLLKKFMTTLFFQIVKYTVKVYTPNSQVRGYYELTVRIKGQGKQKTADHVLYETTQVRERYDILSFVFRVKYFDQICNGVVPYQYIYQNAFCFFYVI